MKVILSLMLSMGIGAVAKSEESHSYLNALQGMDGGYCVVLEDEQGNVKELVTTEGGLSKGQIRKAVRYASYRQHLVGGGLLALGPAVVFGVKPARLSSAIIFTSIALPAVFGMNQVRYLQKLASDEQETSVASIMSMFSIIPPVSFVTEQVIRASRANHITDRRKKLRFSSSDSEDSATLGFAKLDKITERMKELPAKYPESCSHLL